MARRAQQARVNDSQKENSGVSAKVKKEKVKEEKVKNESQRRKTRRVEEDEEPVDELVEDEQDDQPEPSQWDEGNGEDQENGDGGDEDAEGEDDDGNDDNSGEESLRSRKRARVNDDGDSVVFDAQEKGKGRARMATLPRDADGFIPGSIVRIQLQNFVTYDWVEFRPGPYLNMILGPNGTGKSSIACAICLGLNWPPSVLGRAAELNSFVKHGADSGHIEIELKAPKGKPNLIIKRRLNAKDKGSIFTLNGVTSTGREITSRMAELNVQVGNLCSFLPQDKVSEFAGMSPQQLLKETQRAAGDENLTSWHNTLIRSGKDLKELQDTLVLDREQLKTMETRNAGLENDVKRYNERRQMEHDMEILEVLIPVQEYREIRAKYFDMKKKQRALHEKVNRLREKNEPVHELVKTLTKQHAECDKARNTMKKGTQLKFGKMKLKWTESETLEAAAEDTTTKLGDLKKSEKERIKKIKTLETEIAKIEADLAEPVIPEPIENIVADLKALTEKFAGSTDRQAEVQRRQMEHIDQTSYQKAQIEAGILELRGLDDANVRKLQSLHRWDRDCHDAIVWLRKNQDKFRMQVFEPPIISLTVPNKNFTNAVEACFNGNQLRTFVTQCQEDLDLLNKYVNDDEALGRKARINTWFRPKHENSIVGPPMGRDELAGLGFDGYAIEYVDCPDGLLWYLKKDLNLHRTAIGLNGTKVDVANAMQAVTRFDQDGRGGSANFIAGSTLNIVARSQYGRRLVQNMTRDVRQARNLVNSAIDPEVKKGIDGKIADARNRLKNLETQSAENDKLAAEVQKEMDEYKKNLDLINARKQTAKDARSRTVTLENRLAIRRERLTQQLNAPSVENERARLKKQLLTMTRKRVKIAREYTELVRAAINDQVEATRVGLEYLQVGANLAALQVLSQTKDARFNEALLEFNKVDTTFSAVKAESKHVLQASREKVFGIDKELRDEYEAIEGPRLKYEKELTKSEEEGTAPPSKEGIDLRSSDELHADLDALRLSLEMNAAANPGVVEQYEKRKREIETLTKTIQDREKKASKIDRGIKTARDNWQPALEKLVGSIGQKFSGAFDRIGCAGEIRISEHEDYDKWAIDILVKFRDKEKLQLLTGQRQSGGERSLTTILYLMSLTEEARAPFSLVDEINQGMDQRAERVVHNSMVEVTCKADSAQYFLITPKLLPDLDYHERMKVLCVNNGEWLPEERDLGNMMNMIEAFIQRRDRGSNAS